MLLASLMNLDSNLIIISVTTYSLTVVTEYISCLVQYIFSEADPTIFLFFTIIIYFIWGTLIKK